MINFKTLLRGAALLSLSAVILSAPTSFAQEQSNLTPADTHDHKEHQREHQHDQKTDKDDGVVEIFPGTFAEVDGDHTLGLVNAPVTMIIYASVTCGHCSAWFTSVWPDIKKNLVDKGKLRVVFREFPTQPQNIAVIGFQIANCAPEDKFFEMIEYQMLNQKDIFNALEAGTGKETYLSIAKKAGLKDEAAMNACIQNQAGYDRINTSMKYAHSAKIIGVPSFIINGEKYTGSAEYLKLAKHIKSLQMLQFSPIIK